ncbi:hypothetical protein M426DRAFT_14051 [Hypoxylon sp. CI-4A]|nr:hypothetical protein M426DRAFT_14051 [Hypoxylon sp. CI-4A]
MCRVSVRRQKACNHIEVNVVSEQCPSIWAVICQTPCVNPCQRLFKDDQTIRPYTPGDGVCSACHYRQLLDNQFARANGSNPDWITHTRYLGARIYLFSVPGVQDVDRMRVQKALMGNYIMTGNVIDINVELVKRGYHQFAGGAGETANEATAETTAETTTDEYISSSPPRTTNESDPVEGVIEALLEDPFVDYQNENQIAGQIQGQIENLDQNQYQNPAWLTQALESANPNSNPTQ